MLTSGTTTVSKVVVTHFFTPTHPPQHCLFRLYSCIIRSRCFHLWGETLSNYMQLLVRKITTVSLNYRVFEILQLNMYI